MVQCEVMCTFRPLLPLFGSCHLPVSQTVIRGKGTSARCAAEAAAGSASGAVAAACPSAAAVRLAALALLAAAAAWRSRRALLRFLFCSSFSASLIWRVE